eukprot:2498639-Rhodomonas_salina.2
MHSAFSTLQTHRLTPNLKSARQYFSLRNPTERKKAGDGWGGWLRGEGGAVAVGLWRFMEKTTREGARMSLERAGGSG